MRLVVIAFLIFVGFGNYASAATYTLRFTGNPSIGGPFSADVILNLDSLSNVDIQAFWVNEDQKPDAIVSTSLGNQVLGTSFSLTTNGGGRIMSVGLVGDDASKVTEIGISGYRESVSRDGLSNFSVVRRGSGRWEFVGFEPSPVPLSTSGGFLILGLFSFWVLGLRRKLFMYSV